jgi:hypothetical protein
VVIESVNENVKTVVRFPAGEREFIFSTTFILVFGAHSAHQWEPEFLSLGIKQPGLEAHYSPPYIAEIKNVWSYTPPPHTHTNHPSSWPS